MIRKEYMDLCIKTARLPWRMGNPAKEVPERYQVIYEGIHYYPMGYEVRFDPNGVPYEIAVMHDLKADSITRGELKKVTRADDPLPFEPEEDVEDATEQDVKEARKRDT